MRSDKTICLIPARGGSKRIPNKNLIKLFGKPMLSYTIEAAIRSKLFGNNIYLSSDSEQILKIADSYKQVQKIKRPKNISTDNASLESATLHLVKKLDFKKFDYLCLLLPNCPLRNSKDIINSFHILKKKKANCLMSVADYHWLNPFWALEEKSGRLRQFFGNKYFINSQKLPKNIFCPSGAVRWVKIKNFIKEKKFYGKNLAKYEIPFERSIDIDTYEDLNLAEKIHKHR